MILMFHSALAGAPAWAAGPESCETAGRAAEVEWHLPSGLLNAIGRVESGRATSSGRIEPYPFTINASGQGRFFETANEAVSATRDLLLRGITSIDVGCFQVNLMHHPDAFPHLEDAFDSAANAAYAARFLSELHTQTGDWDRSVMLYHSATPAIGAPYRDRVMAGWQGQGADLSSARRPAPAKDPFVVLISAEAARVRVWTPLGTASPRRRPAGLPAVITPEAFTQR
jgi:hypothetical protein